MVKYTTKCGYAYNPTDDFEIIPFFNPTLKELGTLD
jgi:hypothetical protein